jgi:hypothetical protein
VAIEQTSTAISVRHIRLHSDHRASAVHDALLKTLPQLDPALARHAQAGDADWVERQRRDGPPLWLFEMRDHGALLALEHRPMAMWQYEIGNPLTAESMTRNDPGAGLYAPLRVLLRDLPDGGCLFEYDLPSDFFGQFGNPDVTAVGHDLDRELDAALRKAIAAATP